MLRDFFKAASASRILAASGAGGRIVFAGARAGGRSGEGSVVFRRGSVVLTMGAGGGASVDFGAASCFGASTSAVEGLSSPGLDSGALNIASIDLVSGASG